MFDPFLTEKQILRKLGGDKISGKAYTYDGILEGKEYVEAQPGQYLVKISNETCDYNTINSVAFTGEKGTIAYSKENLSFEYIDEAGSVSIQYDGRQIAAIINETLGDVLSPGIWGLYEVNEFSGIYYVSEIQLTETIVPINTKYLGDKVIDLAKYIPSTYNSFNDIVLALFAEGGGRLIFHNDTTFWSDVDKYNHLKFAIDANELVPGLMVECASNSRTISEGVTTSIEFSFLVFLNGCMRATVAFQRDTNLDNSIIVVVEPLTIPGA